jgi:hypothetical protein
MKPCSMICFFIGVDVQAVDKHAKREIESTNNVRERFVGEKFIRCLPRCGRSK